MASLSPAFQRSAQSADGGFAWWYADLVDTEGSGLVVIWSLGLPFLAGTRRGERATSRPSIQFALYRYGHPVFYLLQEHPPDSVTGPTADGAAQIGESRFELQRRGTATRLLIALNEPIPNSKERLVATLELTGQAPQLEAPSDGATHLWTPRLLHAMARAKVTVGARQEELAGVGYFDGNASTRPLHDQGIESWRWTQFTLGEHAYVVYDILGKARSTHVLKARGDGTLAELAISPRFSDLRRGLYGITSPRRIELDLPEGLLVIQASQPVDDGPFYQRFMVEAHLETIEPGTEQVLGRATHAAKDRGFGLYEIVLPERLDRPWQRPFVRMRTHRVGGRNSMWLPLFSGWRAGRAKRLLSGLAALLLRRLPSNSPQRERTP